MPHETDSFSAIEALIMKHAPLLMRVGGDEMRRDKRAGVPSKWRPSITSKTVSRMKRLRADGSSIGEIARACRVSWSTAWRHSKQPVA